MKARPSAGIAIAALVLVAASAALALPPPPASAPAGSVAPSPTGAGRPAPGTPAASGGGIGFTPAGGNSNAPIDITADNLEMFQPQHLTIYKGNVEVNQDTTRMRTPELRIYSRPKTAPGAAPPPASKGGAMMLDGENSSIDHMEAAGPFYYITPTQNARSDFMRYDGDPNTITLTGNVVLVQGKDVATGDRLVIDRNTGHNQLFKDAGKRVRTILHPNQPQAGQPGQAKPGQPTAPAHG